jgi:hypothetical protein
MLYSLAPWRLLCLLVLILHCDWSTSCSENWKFLKMNSIITRADGIGTNLLDHSLAISVCHKLEVLPVYPHWVHRAGTKNCFNNICGSVYHDAMKQWIDQYRASLSSMHLRNATRHADELTVCPPLPRSSSQKNIRGIIELKEDLVTAVRSRISPNIEPLFDSNTRLFRPPHSSPSVCVHYRLFDVEQKKNTVSSLTTSHDCDEFIHQFDKASLSHVLWPFSKDKCNSKYQQSSYSDDSMLAISKALTKKYPSHRKYLVGCDSNSRLSPEATNELVTKAKHWGYDHVQCSQNNTVSDLDIRFLSQCDIIVAGHSSFSIMAMAFSPHGATLYSPKWSGSVAAGLFTKHDNSGVKSIAELLSAT